MPIPFTVETRSIDDDAFELASIVDTVYGDDWRVYEIYEEGEIKHYARLRTFTELTRVKFDAVRRKFALSW